MRCRCTSGSNPGDDRLAEAREERVAVAAAPDVLADGAGFVVIVDDEVVAARVLQRLRRRRLRLLVPVLAVDDRREAFLRVALHVLPDVQHRAAGRVDERAAARAEVLQRRDRDAERRQDDDVVWRRAVDASSPGSLRKRMPSAAELIVDVRVVDDFAGQVHACDRGSASAPGRRSPPRDRRRSRTRTRAARRTSSRPDSYR